MTKERYSILGDALKAASHPILAFNALKSRLFPNDPEVRRVASWMYGKLKREEIQDIFPAIKDVNISLVNAFNKTVGVSADLLEVATVSAIVKLSKAKKILEIGTFDGNTTLNMAANSDSKSRITTLDLPPEWEGKTSIDIPDAYVNVTARNRIGIQFRGTEYESKIKQVFEDSAKVDWKKLGGPFDFIFIDGCHHYDYVKLDTRNALDNIKSGGIIIWHDYGSINDVSGAVDELIGKIELHAIKGTRLAIGKIK